MSYTKQQHTEFTKDIAASKYHRLLGKQCYGADVDMIEYCYEKGKVKLIAVMDYKHASIRNISLKHSSMQMQIELSNQLNLPFFTVLTYLDDTKFDVPMYFVIPSNVSAKVKMSGHRKTDCGVWMTVMEFSKFQHELRNLIWNGNEIVNDFLQLNQLSNVKKIYKLPEIEIG